MELVAKEAQEKVELPDGAYEGKVVEVRLTPVEKTVDGKTERFEYVDVFIDVKLKKDSRRLKAGYPSDVSTRTLLGNLLERFGQDISPGSRLDPEEVLVGRSVKFMVLNKGGYARVIRESLAPA